MTGIANTAPVNWVTELRALLAQRDDDQPLIDFGIGQPDGLMPEAATRALASLPPDVHHYPASLGAEPLRTAASAWLLARFGASVPPDGVAVTHGSKLAIALAAGAFARGGSVVVPTPGYQTYRAAALAAGATVRWLTLDAPTFLPERGAVEAAFEGADLAYLNYPCNPTGVCADRQTLQMIVDVARATGTVIVHDAAYLDLVYAGDGVSMLALEGAAGVVVEVHSLSKAFHLAGFRIGFAAGDPVLLDRLGRALTAADTGASRVAQHVAQAVLTQQPDHAEARRARDRSRTTEMANALRRLGCEVATPGAGFYVWFKPPAPVTWRDIVSQAGIACAPGGAFGPAGDGWVRFACVRDDRAYDGAVLRLASLFDRSFKQG